MDCRTAGPTTEPTPPCWRGGDSSPFSGADLEIDTIESTNQPTVEDFPQASGRDLQPTVWYSMICIRNGVLRIIDQDITHYGHALSQSYCALDDLWRFRHHSTQNACPAMSHRVTPSGEKPISIRKTV